MFHMVQQRMSRRPAGRSGSRRRTEEKKDGIRRVALRLFQLRGFKKVTIREIAREADVSQVTIYNYFGSKEGLIRDVVRKLTLDVIERYRALMADDRSFPEKLEDILLGKTELVSQYGGEFAQRVLVNDPEMQEFVKRLYDREIKPMIVGFFDEGKRQGYVNPELSREAILSYTEIFRNGLMARPELLVGSKKPVRLVRELMTLYLYGVMGKSAPETRSGDMKERGKGTEWPVMR
jgi:AcrR family transcriptional regulator